MKPLMPVEFIKAIYSITNIFFLNQIVVKIFTACILTVLMYALEMIQ